jgi:hypothetical protein
LTGEENLVSMEAPYYNVGGTQCAPFDTSIQGRFLERNADGTFKIDNFLKAKNIIATGQYDSSGARGFWK